jgi:hypothetical protein
MDLKGKILEDVDSFLVIHMWDKWRALVGIVTELQFR